MSPTFEKTQRSKRRSGLFVTGTDTEVGKTYVAARIVRAVRCQSPQVSVGVYKPVASGCWREAAGEPLVSDDAVELWEAAGRPQTLNGVCPQRFEVAVAPPVAARQVGQSVDESQLIDGLDVWRDSDFVVVEGAGGLLSPLSKKLSNADLAAEFGFPLIVVAGNRLGVINHTLLTLETARAQGLVVAGVVLSELEPQDASDASRGSNLAQLQMYCDSEYGVPVLAHLKHGGDQFEPSVDWESVAQ